MDILNTVDALAASFPKVTKESLENLLHLHFSENGGNEYFTFFMAGAADSVSGAELRYSKADGAKKMLILRLHEPSNVSEDDVRARYPDLTPSGGPATGLYLIKKETWGEIRFGFGDNEGVSTLVFDSIE
jgi:hypothetical protein